MTVGGPSERPVALFFVLLFVKCLWKMKGIQQARHFSTDPNVSLNYLLSRVNINDVWELESSLETNMFEIEMPNEVRFHTGREKENVLVSKLLSAFVTHALRSDGTGW